MYLRQDGKCAITGMPIDLTTDASVDRIDSMKGYTKDNIWWVKKEINLMKNNLSLEEFILLCKMVADKI
jgi:hypothetical protein